MSKMNAIRIINLNYNNNSIRIEDETFHLEGDSTLLSLQNGGGKSVLVQMIMAPFVHKRYRDTSDRPFASYFTTNRPTFILVEWKLEGGAGYVLTGMMVRKKQEVSTEDAKDELDMINFIYEYKTSNDYDIDHIPVIEKDGRTRKLQGFVNCRTMFEGLKKERGRLFQHFDMNQQAQQRQYFDRLKEYQINHTEWESIVKKVNLKESGLSELFREAKDEAGLVEKWFLPAVESKLNKEEDRIKRFQELIYKFIRQYKENQSKIERRDTIRIFQTDALEVQSKAQQHLSTLELKRGYEGKLALLREQIKLLLEEAEQKQRHLEETVLTLEEKVKQVELEEASYQIHCQQDEKIRIEQQLEEKIRERDQLQREKEQLEYRLHVLECARLYEAYRNCSGEVLLLENQLELLKEQEKDMLPERNNLGYNLRVRYELTLERKKEYYRLMEEQLQQQEHLRQNMEDKEEQQQKKLGDLKQTVGKLNEQVKSFDEKEQELFKRCGVKLDRNILGVYEEGNLELLVADYQRRAHSCYSELLQKKTQNQRTEETRNICTRDIEDRTGVLGKQTILLEQKEMLLDDYDRQLVVRHDTLRFMELKEDQIFHMDAINESFHSKLSQLKGTRQTLERQKEACEQELAALETGRMLELPKDFIELMTNLDLNYVFGMDWIKRNGRTEAENQTLVRLNPLLPYSIIMSEKELGRLQQAPNSFYTSFPIPILIRESLDQAMGSREGSLCSFPGISFYIVFNEHLLNEEALQRLVEDKQIELSNYLAKIKHRDKEIALYEGKWNDIRYQSVTETSYHLVKKELEELAASKKQLEQELVVLRHQKDLLGQQQELLFREIQELEKQEKLQKQIGEELVNYQKKYEQYKEQRYDLERSRKEVQKLEDTRNQNKQEFRVLNQQIQEGRNRRDNENRQIQDVVRKMQPFGHFLEGQEDNRDLEDLEARYEAITKDIGSSQKQLEEMLGKEYIRLKDAQEVLLNQQTRYQLNESAFREEVADLVLENETNRVLERSIADWNKFQESVHEIITRIAVWESRLEEAKRKLEDNFQLTEPLSRERITDLEFVKRRKLIQGEIAQERLMLKELGEQLRTYKNNRESLEEFNQLIPEADSELLQERSIYGGRELGELTALELTELRGRLVRDYHECEKFLLKHRELVKKEIERMEKNPIFEEEFFHKPIETMLLLLEMPGAVLDQLQVIQESYLALLEKLEIDIAILTKEKDKIIDMLMEYIEEVHKNLSKIDRNSTITVRERSVKMLKIKLVDWMEQENIYRTRFLDLLEDVTQRGLARLQQNENMEEMLGVYITTRNLYHTIVGIHTVNIKLYKIEAQKEYPISWAEVAKNSGGEGFLSAFVVLSSLLSYMRREDTDLFLEREEGKVLVMDNPFAQTNAAHLLKPLMDVAKKSNTQLICLTGLGGESIYNRFDNIYVLNLVESGLTRDVQYLKGDHIKGEEEVQKVVASQVKIETMDQMELLF